MTGWGWALLLKPLVAILLFVAVFGSAHLLMRAVRRFVPDGWVKRWLFSDRWGHRPESAASPAQGRLNNTALLGGDSREDAPRP